jgi:predicted RNase H-like HicB family nuclease
MKLFNAVMHTENGKTYGFFPDIVGLKFEGYSFEEAFSNGVSELNKFLNEFEDPEVFQNKSSKESLKSTHWTSDIVPLPFHEAVSKTKIKKSK